MEPVQTQIKPEKPRRFKTRYTWIGIATIISLGLVFTYLNFNKLLTAALYKNFNSSSIAEIYELKFENLSVNFITGNIKVSDVRIEPRAVPLKDYPYINSHFKLKAGKIKLINVKLFELLRHNKLQLSTIEIAKPNITFQLDGERVVLLPFTDSKLVKDTISSDNKATLSSFLLEVFILRGANIEIIDSYKQKKTRMNDLNISLKNINISMNHLEADLKAAYVNVDFKGFTSQSQTEGLRSVKLNNFILRIDSVDITSTIDTLRYGFKNFNADLAHWQMNTHDSLFFVGVDSVKINYQKQLLRLRNVKYKPNSDVKSYAKTLPFQKEIFSINVGSIALNRINFDSLIYHKCLFVEQIDIDSLKATIYKDKTRPFDSTRFPTYLGQQIAGVPIPFKINKVEIKNSDIAYHEKKADGDAAAANINQVSATVTNVTNKLQSGFLDIKAVAFIEKAAPLNAEIKFMYAKPQFEFEVNVNSFDLMKLNTLIQSFAPVTLKSGTVDKIKLTGLASNTGANGNMTFLYHDLVMEMQLQEQAKWKNSIISFAANSVVISNNPSGKDNLIKNAVIQIDRDVNKGFVNVILKSFFNGVKETVVPEKVNRQLDKAAKKKKNK